MAKRQIYREKGVNCLSTYASHVAVTNPSELRMSHYVNIFCHAAERSLRLMDYDLPTYLPLYLRYLLPSYVTAYCRCVGDGVLKLGKGRRGRT